MADLDCLKTVDRTIAIGNRRVVITFDAEKAPTVYAGILPGDYLCWNRKRGWYCSASVVNPEDLAGIFIDREGYYLSANALAEPPCKSKGVKLYNMPPLRDFRKIEGIREILDNSLTAAGFEKLPDDLSAAFWSCDDRFYNRIKRPLLIKSYRKLCEKYRIKGEPFLEVKGTVVRTFAEEGKPELDLLKAHKLLLVNAGGQDSSNQVFWVLHEFMPNIFYILNNTLRAPASLRREDYEKLLSMPEVRKFISFPKTEIKDLMFTYEDGTQSEQLEQKEMLGIPVAFRDGTRAIVRPYCFLCFNFDEFRQTCARLPKFEDKKWSLPKREHLVELAHHGVFNEMLRKLGIREEWSREWAYTQEPFRIDVAETYMSPVMMPAYWTVEEAYERIQSSARTHTTINDCVRILFIMYL